MNHITDNKFLQELKQYHFDRKVFVDVFEKVFSIEELYDLEVACQEHRYLGNFLLYYAEGEFYIIHLLSGTIINWYKHLGRTNTCNKEEFDIFDLKDFFELLKEEISYYESEE